MKQEVECLNCKHAFWAEVWKKGYCPHCGKTFIWDSMCEGTADEYCFPNWDPGFLPEFVEVGAKEKK